jgi:Zn-dependent protease
MVSALSVGRFYNIELGVHPSWVVVYALVTWSIASTIDGVPRVVSLALGGLCALLLFASVLVHEFAHALVARRFGVRTRGITLFLFGGVATLECEPPSPRAEIAIALAGPAMSGLVAAAAAGVMFGFDALGDATFVAAAGLVASYVAIANAVLALFNLVPAFPMDGGRVLRALLWHWTKRRASATATSALVGAGFAAVLVAAGAAMLGSTRTWQFGWYVVLGAYLGTMSWRNFTAAQRLVRFERTQEAAAAAQAAALAGLTAEPA